MYKESYLEALYNALKDKTKDTNAQKIIEYYEQYFDDGVDLGKTEQQILIELGDAETLAAEVLSGMQIKAQDLFSSDELVRMIDVTLLDIRVHVVFSERQEVSITYQGIDEYNPELLSVEFISNHLRIIQKANRVMPWQHYAHQESKPYLLVELPKSYKGKLQFETRDSRIIVDGKNYQTRVKLHLRSRDGKVECNELSCRSVDVATRDGRIKMAHCTMETMELESVAGRIEIDRCIAKYVHGKCQEGRIVLDKSRAELTELENIDGRIIVNESLIDDCRMENEDGKIVYSLLDDNRGLHLDLLSRLGKLIVNGKPLDKGVLAIKDLKPKKKEKRYLNVYARTSGGRIEIIH